MLRELRIRNFAILEEASLEFGSGLNVITGETGAGKSVVLEALGVALGDRASRDRVRSGADEAVVELIVDGVSEEALERLGIEPGEPLIIRRHVSAAGKSRIYLSGMLATAQNLRDILEGAVDVHGQFEHQALLAENRQLRLLDTAAGHEAEVTELGRLFSVARQAATELETFRSQQRDLARKADLLRYQLDEIEAARLSVGEDEILEGERARLANSERLSQAAEQGRAMLREEGTGALDRVQAVLAALETIGTLDPGAGVPRESLVEALSLLEDVSDFLRDYGDALEHAPGRLDEVMARLDLIDRLKRKYGDTVREIMEHGEEARTELDACEHPEHRARELETVAEKAWDAYERLAVRIGKNRRKASEELGGRVEKALGELAMPGGRFRIEVEEDEPGPNGRERARFLLSANPGEALRPLARIASGGEISRVMLAIKGVLGDSTPVLVFDEVDAGIGGQAALAVAERLRDLAREHQVISVTHQPSVAAAGDHHLRIRKSLGVSRTQVEAGRVEGDERIGEIARMLGGTDSLTSRKHAEELVARHGAQERSRRKSRAGTGSRPSSGEDRG